MKSIIRYAFLFGAAGAMFTSCSNEDFAVEKDAASGKTIHMTVSALRESDDVESRTSLEELNGGLSCVWTAGDKILVTNNDGKVLGSLVMAPEGDGQKEAEFSGNLMGVENGTQTLNYFYLGTAIGGEGNDYEACESRKPYVCDFSVQPGTLVSLSEKDILTTSKSTIINGADTYFAKLGFQRRISFARFKMNLPEGAAYPVSLTIEGGELNNTASLSLADQSIEWTKGGISIAEVNGQEFYITYLPTAAADELTVTAIDKNGKAYVGKYNVSKAVAQNKYFRKALGDGQYERLPINFEAVEKEFTLTYNANYDGCPEAKPVTANSSDDPYTFTVADYTDLFAARDRYTFTGWNTQADGKGQKVAAGSQFEVAYPGTTLYAQWTKDKVNFKLIYHQNHENSSLTATSYSGDTTKDYFDFEVEGYAGLPSFGETTKDGYVFTGYWNTKADGSGDSYAIDDKFRVSYPDVEGHLYAQWKEIEYTVKLKWEGEDGETLDQQTTEKVKHGTTVPVSYSKTLPTKDGYEFTGWVKKGTTEAAPTSITVTSNVDLVFVPTWKKKPTVTTPGYDHGSFNK